MTYENRPDDLVKPDLTHFFKKELDEFEIWQKKIQLSNLELTIRLVGLALERVVQCVIVVV
jgi:hypothetical protein